MELVWNYRIVRRRFVHKDESGQEHEHFRYAIHEAYYDANGHVGGITENPVDPSGEDVEELRHDWISMADAFSQPILDYDALPEPEYSRENDPVRTELDARIAQLDSGEATTIPWEQVKKELEEKFGPFDADRFRQKREAERLERERIHERDFTGTPSFLGLIDKICADFRNKERLRRKLTLEKEAK